MSDWQEEENNQWPVKYPVEAPPQASDHRFRESTALRWTNVAKADTEEIRKRLLWLLLVVNIGMVLAAACVLPLVFLDLPIQDEGVVGAVSTELGQRLGLSSQLTCLILALPILIMLLTVGLSLWWVRRVGYHAKET
jgi:hypothetical protein